MFKVKLACFRYSHTAMDDGRAFQGRFDKGIARILEASE
jgi:hypothetical protein